MKKFGAKQTVLTIMAAAAFSQAATAEFNWSNVSMGGGGFVSAVIASPVDKGLFYARTDVGGAYRWNESTARWESMMDWVDGREPVTGIAAVRRFSAVATRVNPGK